MFLRWKIIKKSNYPKFYLVMKFANLFFVNLLMVVSCTKPATMSMSSMPTEMGASEINENVRKFYDNLYNIVSATVINGTITKSTDVSAEDCPIINKLASFDIENEEGESVSFFDLSSEEKLMFMETYSQVSKEILNAKIEMSPEIEEYIILQNEIVEECLEEESVITKSGVMQIPCADRFFASIQSRLEQRMMTHDENISGNTRSGGKESPVPTVPDSVVLQKLSGVAKRGDVIVALPRHGVPDVIFDTANKKYMVGHAEIFVKDVKNTTGISDNGVTIGAWTGPGICYNSLLNWRYESYLLGIYKDKWKFTWKKGLHRVYTPVSNPSKLATKAEEYVGHEYVKWYEFLTPKWVAPKRFTCTTLVWWCAKEVYDVKISPWYTAMVTPSAVLSDEHTYIKTIIE